MGMERVVQTAFTLRKLRSGPLGYLLDGFCDWLLQRGFRRNCVRTHLEYVCHWSMWLAEKSWSSSQRLSWRQVELFFQARRLSYGNRGSLEGHLRRTGHSINRFCRYLKELDLFDPLEKPAIEQPILEAYLSWMRDHQQAAPGTLRLGRHGVKQFLQWLGPEACPDTLAQLSAQRIEHFFINCTAQMGRGARRSMQASLRTFLRFCLQQAYIRADLAQAVPTLRSYKLAGVPRGLSQAQAKALPASVNRHTDTGRRDYAILQLLYTYGVRAGQVRALCLQDIFRAKDQILIRACKNGKDSLLPLTAVVGESLLEYLQHARLPYPFPEVFLTCRAPCHPFSGSSSVSAIVERYLTAAGIHIAGKGANAFRHCFATRMISRGHSLKAVADVLGHRSLSTTFIYTKVDFNALKEVAMEWPQEVNHDDQLCAV